MITQSENQIVEWKEIWNDKYLEWICGYANAQGGILYIGVDDNGNIIGIDSKTTKKLLEDIPNKISSAFGITCDVNLKNECKKNYIEIKVNKSPLPLNLHGRYYYRTGSVKKEITGFELTEFIMKTTGASYDEMLSDIERDDLTFDALKKRYTLATDNYIDLDKDLVSFKLVKGNNKMTNAGVLFADQWTIHHSRVFCTRWNGLEKANEIQDALDDDEYVGSLVSLFDNTLSFIRRNTKKGWRKSDTERIELPDYPERALEEGITNALIHRSYVQTGANIQVDIYDDRLVITNPGGMFDGTEVQSLDLRSVPSKLRNPIIADLFGRLKLMERRGSGFRKILDSYETQERYNENYKPVFYSDGYNFFLTLWNLNYAFDKAQNKAQNKAQRKTLNGKEYVKLLLQENPSLTQKDLANMTGKSRRTIQTIIKKMLEEGTLERIGSKKTGSWVVKE